MTLRLIPVVELEPSRLGIENFTELHQLGQWPEHWRNVLAELALEPIQPGSWFVACAEFVDRAAFDVLLREHLGVGPSLRPLDEISPVPGGYALSVDGSIVLEPGCCCDLADLADWSQAFKRGGYVPLSIGHGGFSLTTEADQTTVTVEPEMVGWEAIRLRFPHSDFALAIDRAEQEQRSFADSLKAHLSRAVPSDRVVGLVDLLVFSLRGTIALP